MKKKLKKSAVLGILLSTVAYGGLDVHAQEVNESESTEETTESVSYTTKDIEVEGELKDPFGNVITEQSYYRTGGDVNVIDRDMIEKRHYEQLTDALRHVPGVLVRTPGFRGGEFQIANNHNVVSINGDDRVVVLVDGRRVDNSVSDIFGSYSDAETKANVDINQVINMNGIEKIEVIKGPGASIYGSDATGGVINIITRKGIDRTEGTLDISTGSWHRHNYKLSYAGSLDENRLKYFVGLSREMSGDSKYKDGLSGNTYTFVNTGYKDEAANIRIDYDFDKNHTLRFAHNHMQSDADYPMAAPDHKYFNPTDWERIKRHWLTPRSPKGESVFPGFRTKWAIWAATGAFSAYNKNNHDLTYVFHRDSGMESFVRVYQQNERYWGSNGQEDILADTPVPETPEWYAWAKAHYKGRDFRKWYDRLGNEGIQLQLGKAYGKHNVLTTWSYDSSEYDHIYLGTGKTYHLERSTLTGYLQDKIFLSDKWELTPAVRYARYNDIGQRTKTDVESTIRTSGGAIFTPSLNTQYAFDKATSAYFGYSRIHRPIKVDDYTNDLGPRPLEDEKGDVWTVGVRHAFSKDTSLAVHYNYTHMVNAITEYSVWDDDEGDFTAKSINAKEVKKAFNLSLSHRFRPHWSLTLNYTHAFDKFSAKDGLIFDPALTWANGNVNAAINDMRPANVYMADLVYENGKLNTSLTGTWYTGCNTAAFTSARALLLDFNINYKLHDDMTIYASVSNLTNQSYETIVSEYHGKGSWPEAGLRFMIGAKYTF